MATSGIRFNDYFFSEPINLAAWTPPKCGSLYSILVDDPNWAPKSFQPLYFGEFGNNAQITSILRDCGQTATAAANGKTLFVSVLPLPFSTTQQRVVMRNELIWAYNPPCQATGAGPSSDLAVKLAELEKKHQEQTAQMMQLLATMNAEAPATRRRIGFISD